MANYLLAYRGGGMPETPRAQKQELARWGKWFQKLGEAVVDSGNPISQRSIVKSDGSVSKLRAGATAITGYSVIKADSLDAAVKLAKGCPLLKSGGSIEVCETFNAM